jgi:hypothetical protein
MTATIFEILSPLPLNREEDARRLIGLWARMAPGILPDRFGTYEPLKQKFSIGDIEGLLARWEYQVLFKRVVKPKLEASVFMQYGPHRKHSTWTISIKEKTDSLLGLVDLLAGSAQEFCADFGFIHKPNDMDLDIGIASKSMSYLDVNKKNISLFITTHLLKVCIPDIYWITLFGKPYVNLFSRERLLSTPAYRVRELDGGAIMVQMTESIGDLQSSDYKSHKERIKEHLSRSAFFDLDRGGDYRYCAPEFKWLEVYH